MSGVKPTPAHIRVLRRCIIGDCWEFTGAKKDGYGRVSGNGGRAASSQSTHRVVWEALVGPIEDTLDHMCRNRACCNPDHLRPMTRGGNNLAGYGPAAIARRRTHCSKGHEYTKDNTLIVRGTERSCRTCHRDRQRSYYREKVSA
jgi:hypothetical protein